MTIGVDVPPVEHEQEALLLMFHHLKLAAAYFEATPLDIDLADLPDVHSKTAMWRWLESMDALYPQEEAD